MKKSKDEPVIFVEVGIVQSVLIFNSSRKGYREPRYTVVDYDLFEGGTSEEIAEKWYSLDENVKEFIKKHHYNEYEKFQEHIRTAEEL